MNTAETSTVLTAKLAGVRGKRLTLALGTGVAWLAVAAVTLLGAGMMVDWKWDLSHGARQALLALDALVLLIIAAIVGFIGYRVLMRGIPPVPTESVESWKRDLRAIQGIGKRGTTP